MLQDHPVRASDPVTCPIVHRGGGPDAGAWRCRQHTRVHLARCTGAAPMPVRDPGRVVRIFPVDSHGQRENLFSYPDYLDYRFQAASFDGVAGYIPVAVTGRIDNGEARDLLAYAVSANYFPLLGIEPSTGRAFAPAEEDGGAASRVAIISHSLWRRRFGADVAVVGRQIVLNERPFTIVGVGPGQFHGHRTSQPGRVDPGRCAAGGLARNRSAQPPVTLAADGRPADGRWVEGERRGFDVIGRQAPRARLPGAESRGQCDRGRGHLLQHRSWSTADCARSVRRSSPSCSPSPARTWRISCSRERPAASASLPSGSHSGRHGGAWFDSSSPRPLPSECSGGRSDCSCRYGRFGSCIRSVSRSSLRLGSRRARPHS